MKGFTSRVTLVALLCAMSAIAAAQGKSGTVTFYKDTAVNGTVLKKGDYRFKFDEQTGELSITQNGAVVASAKAHLVKRDGKSRITTVATMEKDRNVVLRSITPGGDNQAITLNDSQATSAN